MLGMEVYSYGIEDNPRLPAMLRAIRPVVIGPLDWAAWDPARVVVAPEPLGWRQAVATGWDRLRLAGGALALLNCTRFDPALVNLAAGMLGLVIYR